MNSGDTFTCSLIVDKETNLIALGTKTGYMYIDYILSDEEIDQIDLSKEKWATVLKEQHEQIVKLGGEIRSIQKLDENNLIAISHEGAIITYNLSQKLVSYVQEDQFNKYNRVWRILVLDSENFVTVGNYYQIKHWMKINEEFSCKKIYENGGAIFCLDFIKKENQSFITNNFRGYSDLLKFENGDITIVDTVFLNPNLQKCIEMEDQIIIATDYFGRIHIYDLTNFRHLDEFTVSAFKGNWVQKSIETNMILVGTEEYLIFLDSNFEEIFIQKLQVRQILNTEKNDLILLPKNLVKANYSLKKRPEVLAKYRYIKIGLVGDSHVGKTCFCKYLETSTFHNTESSFGKHVWKIPLDDDDSKKLNFFDLAGQGSELYTYFPMIFDSDIILLFYSGSDKNSFDTVMGYYKELKQKCVNSEFYFVQTFSEQRQHFRDSYIEKIFDELGVDFKKQLVKVSSLAGTGFDLFKAKVLEPIEWDTLPVRLKSTLHDKIEQGIHRLYNEGEKTISLEQFCKEVGLNNQTITGKILQSFKSQGMLEYISSRKELILNDEEYEIMHSDIATLMDEENGYARTSYIIEELSTDDRQKLYVENIIDYYRQQHVGIFFREGKKEETLIFPRKIQDEIDFSNEILEDLPKQGTVFFYENLELQLSTIIHFLSQYSLELCNVTNHEILLKTKLSSRYIHIEYNIPLEFKEKNKRYSKLKFESDTKKDFELENEIIKFFFDLLEEYIIDIEIEEKEQLLTISNNHEELLKYVLKSSFEKPYFDFKKELKTDTNYQKFKLVRNLIALSNSAHMNMNSAYLAIGIVEKNQKISAFCDIKDVSSIEQKVISYANNFMNRTPIVQCFKIRINEIYKWSQNKEIDFSIAFTEEQKKEDNEESILIIKITRGEGGAVYELGKEMKFNKNNTNFVYHIGDSWFRIGSHTFHLKEYLRRILRDK